ncbi:MAG: ArsR/SmtB family transcription factor [Planctomycetota bacterium]
MSDHSVDLPNMTITRAPMWQAVRLPLRMRIFETARRLGESSVTELAQAVGLNRTALYFHLRHLERAGLLTSRAGEPTPGRRGKRPRYYRATIQEVSFPVEADSKRDGQKIADFFKPWIAESRSVALDTKSSGGMTAKRVAFHWENFTEDEAGRIRSLCAEIEDVVRRARNRANMTRKAPTANHHLAIVFTPVDGHVMPGPDIKFKAK